MDDYPHCGSCCFWRICILQVQNPGMIVASSDVSGFGFHLLILSLVHQTISILEFIVEINYVQRYMDSEIRAIMAQYMPLDNQPEESNQVHHNI